MLTLPVQLHRCGDETGLWCDTKQSLWVWLRINGEPEEEKVGFEDIDGWNEERAGRNIERMSERKMQAGKAVGCGAKEADRASVWGSDKEIGIQMAKELI